MFSHQALKTVRIVSKYSAAIVVSSALSLAVVPQAHAQARPNVSDSDGNLTQVYVCKYVTTPGQGEELKGGKNPILVDAHSLIDGEIEVGASFSDAHGRSYVVALYEDGMVPPTREDCPDGETEEEIPAPAKPAVNDPCNSAGVTSNISWVVPADTESVVWELGEDGTLTAYAEEGYIFSDETYEHEYTLPADSGIICATNPGGGNVQGATTTATPTAQPTTQLENTGTSAVAVSVLSGAVLLAAVSVMLQNTILGARLYATLHKTFSQPFVVPTI